MFKSWQICSSEVGGSNWTYFLLGPKNSGPLRCFSCGKLGYDECKSFDPSNPEQVKVCEKDEVCMIYAWDKTQNKKGITLAIGRTTKASFTFLSYRLKLKYNSIF